MINETILRMLGIKEKEIIMIVDELKKALETIERIERKLDNLMILLDDLRDERSSE